MKYRTLFNRFSPLIDKFAMLNVPAKWITRKPAIENKEPSNVSCVLAVFLIVTLLTLLTLRWDLQTS